MDRANNDPIVSTPITASVWTKLGLTVAAVAAIGGVFGSFYLGTVFSSAPRETKSVAATETTGSASAQNDTKKEEIQAASAPVSAEPTEAANCREQTWPYIARPCLSNEKGERGVRVISTDKLADPVIGVVEAPPDAVINRKAAAPSEPPKVQAAAPAPTVTNNSGPASAASLKSGASLGAVAISPAAAAPTQTSEPQMPEPVVAASPPPSEPPAQPIIAPQPAVQTAVAVEPQAVPDKRAEKSKRKAAKRQDKENERFKTTVAESDDNDDEPVIERRNSRGKGRVVERWTERDYDVRSHDGSGTRRVIVRSGDDRERDTYSERSVSTERSGGGFPNIFGAIFGGGN